jgi:hypothetical protein
MAGRVRGDLVHDAAPRESVAAYPSPRAKWRACSPTSGERGVAASLRQEGCKTALVDRYNFFIFEVVKAHVAPRPEHPETLHYLGDGEFEVSGKIISRRRLFRPGML